MFQRITFKEPFMLESGYVLPEIELGYNKFGTLNHNKNNVIWVCHALTGNSDPTSWWQGLFGKEALFSPEKYFIICVNMPGSCYGSTGPLSINTLTGKPYFRQFPLVTIRDMVKAQILLRKHLSIEKIHIIIGGSMGGHQSLEWAIMEPHIFDFLLPVATNAVQSPWGIALNEAQRMAIEADPTWQEEHEDAGKNGLKAARAMAMTTYRTYETYLRKQCDPEEKLDNFRASGYQQYQGQKLTERFNAFSSWYLSKAMDSHNLGRNRGGIEASLKNIQAKTVVVGIESDLLFPIHEQEFLARHIPGASMHSISSINGHDGFLTEFEQMHTIFSEEINRSQKNISRVHI